jgi:hypothetical protein
MCGANSAKGRDYGGNSWRDAIGEGGGRIDVVDTFKGKLMWKGGKRVADDVWMLRTRKTTRTIGKRQKDDTWQRGKGGRKDEMTGGWPTLG